jgi:hypothetical protein
MRTVSFTRLSDLRSLPHQLAVKQAEFVAGLSDDQLGWLERGLPRKVIIGSLVYALPRKFVRAVAGDIDGVIELRFVDPAGKAPDQIQFTIRNGKCTATRNGTARPDSIATMHISDLIRMGTGSVEAGWLMHDKRITLSGDPFLFVRFPSSFGLRTVPLYTVHRAPVLVP